MVWISVGQIIERSREQITRRWERETKQVEHEAGRACKLRVEDAALRVIKKQTRALERYDTTGLAHVVLE